MDFSRQEDLLTPIDFTEPITCIGCGGIGSPNALLLAKMGCPQMHLIDGDGVEEHNVPNQMFGPQDVGMSKVHALKSMIHHFNPDCEVSVDAQFCTEKTSLEGIVISGVDSMHSRKNIWQCIRNNPLVPVYIDARLGGEHLEIQTIHPCNPADITHYENTLFDEETQGMQLPCTAQAIMYTGFIVAGFICCQLKKWLKQEEYQRMIIAHLGTNKIHTF